MAYEVIILPFAKECLRKLRKYDARLILSDIETILQRKPLSRNLLNPPLEIFRSLHSGKDRFRIFYHVSGQVVYVSFIAKRIAGNPDDAYKKAENHMDKMLSEIPKSDENCK